MDSLVKSLIRPLLEEKQPGIAIIPGGFKPPTLGHFYLADEVAKRPEVTEAIVLIGHKDRDGITKDQSLAIWNVYKKYLPPNVSIEISEKSSPVSDVHSLIKHNPENFYLPVVGIRSEEDLSDLKRFDSLRGKYDNFEPIVVKSDSTEERISGTNARKAILDGDFESFQRFLPVELSDADREVIWNILTGETIEEKQGFDKKLGKDPYGVSQFARELVKESINEAMYAEPSKFSYPTAMSSLIQHMLSKGMNIRPLPKVKFIDNDKENAQNFFGKTAYYNPGTKEITLFTMDRHPKDIMRSFAHEMIHHEQNCNGKLDNIQTQNTNEEGDLPEIERQAYEKGNMMFRNWTDSITEVKDTFGLVEFVKETFKENLSVEK